MTEDLSQEELRERAGDPNRNRAGTGPEKTGGVNPVDNVTVISLGVVPDVLAGGQEAVDEVAAENPPGAQAPAQNPTPTEEDQPQGPAEGTAVGGIESPNKPQISGKPTQASRPRPNTPGSPEGPRQTTDAAAREDAQATTAGQNEGPTTPTTKQG